jgi:hypothetical protein
MKILGGLLLLAGWLIVTAAIALLKTNFERGWFAAAGAGVEVLGLALAVRAHRLPEGQGR